MTPPLQFPVQLVEHDVYRGAEAGQVVQTLTVVVSPDGKTTTATITGTNVNGQPVNTTAVYDKQ
jgi:hypothetical protein